MNIKDMREREQRLLEKLQKETSEHNDVVKIAVADGRTYITPEDVAEAFKTIPEAKVRLDVLEVLGNCSGFGVEDDDLTAFVAFEGKKSY